MGVAGAAAGERGEERLVVAEPEADGRVVTRCARASAATAPSLSGSSDADVGVAVGDEQQRRAALAGDAARLLQAAQVAAAEVGRAAGRDARDQAADGVLVVQRAGGDGDVDLVVEHDEAEVVGRLEAADEVDQRGLRGLERSPAIEPRAVEHDLQRAGRAGARGPRGGGGELEEDRDLVLGFDGDDVEVERGVEMHVHSVGATSAFLTGRLRGRPSRMCGIAQARLRARTGGQAARDGSERDGADPRRTTLAPSVSSPYAHHASAAREPTSAADRTGPSLTAATTRRPWAIRTGAFGGWKIG